MTVSEYVSCSRCRTPALMRARDLPRGFDAVWDDATGMHIVLCRLCARALRERASHPVRELAGDDAHLYLWTINRYIEDAYGIARAWGFKPSTMLVWAKTPFGGGLGGTYGLATEYVLFARRGSLTATQRVGRNWFDWKRAYDENGKPAHSRKPDAFLDMVEATSPGPYLEMFARRNRLGWDTWGNEALEHVEIA